MTYSDDEPVGYGAPPRQYQFKKGVSGNPKGRPKGAKNKPSKDFNGISRIIVEEGARSINVNDRDGGTKMPTTQAIVRAMNLKAMKGDVRAMELSLRLQERADDQEINDKRAIVLAAMELRERHLEILEEGRRQGGDYDIPIPHPDLIQIDFENAEVTVDGPTSEEGYQFVAYFVGKILMLNFCLYHEKCLIGDEQKFRANEQIQDEVAILERWKFILPENHPLFVEIAPRYRDQIIDFCFYYGDDPSLPELPQKLRYKNAALHERPVISSETRSQNKAYDLELREFKTFMRKHVEAEMGGDWADRLETENLVARNVEHDKIRWFYHEKGYEIEAIASSDWEVVIPTEAAKLEAFLAW